MTLLRSLLFTAIMFVSVLPWSILVIISRLGGEALAYRMVITWSRGITWLCRVLCGLDYRLEGAEHLPDDAAIVMMKHSSAYETILQMVVFPRQTWVLKRELMWAPFLGWALATVRPIAINRGAGRRAVEQVIRQGRERLDRGVWVMIFPEGTRMPAGERGRYGQSGAILAVETGRPVVPVAHDAGDFWPRRGFRKRPGTITVRLGPPIQPAGRSPRELTAEVERWIESAVADIRGPEKNPGL